MLKYRPANNYQVGSLCRSVNEETPFYSSQTVNTESVSEYALNAVNQGVTSLGIKGLLRKTKRSSGPNYGL